MSPIHSRFKLGETVGFRFDSRSVTREAVLTHDHDQLAENRQMHRLEQDVA